MESVSGPDRVVLPGKARCGAWLIVLVLALGMASPPPALGQVASVAGRVLDSRGGPVASAAIVLRERPTGLPVVLVISDSLGRFLLDNLQAGDYELSARRLGFGETVIQLALSPTSRITVEVVLPDTPLQLEGLTVWADRAMELARDAGLTTSELAGVELKLLPGFLEADLLRALEFLPGVVSVSDFSASYHVRGGAADQNLILIDGFPIYNPFHLGGFFSVFNADMVASATLLSGGFPAQHGGRVSSVLEVESDVGGSGLEADLGVSLLAARLALGADVPQYVTARLGLSSARVRGSIRRSYFDAAMKPFVELPYHLIDRQVVFEAWTPTGGRWLGTAYTGRDVLDLSRLSLDQFPLRLRWHWGNSLGGLRHVRPLSGGNRFLDLRLGYSRFETAMRFPDFDDMRFESRIDHALVRADVQTTVSRTASWRAGLEMAVLDHMNRAEAAGTDFGSSRSRGLLSGGYAQAEIRRASSWILEAGSRLDHWLPSDGDAVAVFSPRLAVKRLFLESSLAVKLAVGRYSQFVQSVRDEDVPIGIDIWVLAGERAAHVISDQVQGGIEVQLPQRLSASLEAYLRGFDGLSAWNVASDPNEPGDYMLSGSGRSYGADFLVRREGGPKLNGWLMASWLRALHRFPDVHDPTDPPREIEYPPHFDRRLNFNLVLRANLPGGLLASMRWTYGSQLPYTRPLGSYSYYDPQAGGGKRLVRQIQGENVQAIVLGPRHGERYPPYHRLDAGVRRSFDRRWGSITPHLDVVNLYNRRNVLFYFYRYDRDPPVRSGISMFPLLPTLGIDVRF